MSHHVVDICAKFHENIFRVTLKSFYVIDKGQTSEEKKICGTSIQNNKWALSQENLILLYANNKGTDQPVYWHNLISTFIICILESIIANLTTHKVSIFLLGRTPKDQLFCNKAYTITSTGLLLRVRNKNLFFLFLNQNICCGHPKSMFIIMGKKINAILRSKTLLI